MDYPSVITSVNLLQSQVEENCIHSQVLKDQLDKLNEAKYELMSKENSLHEDLRKLQTYKSFLKARCNSLSINNKFLTSLMNDAKTQLEMCHKQFMNEKQDSERCILKVQEVTMTMKEQLQHNPQYMKFMAMKVKAEELLAEKENLLAEQNSCALMYKKFESGFTPNIPFFLDLAEKFLEIRKVEGDIINLRVAVRRQDSELEALEANRRENMELKGNLEKPLLLKNNSFDYLGIKETNVSTVKSPDFSNLMNFLPPSLNRSEDLKRKLPAAESELGKEQSALSNIKRKHWNSEPPNISTGDLSGLKLSLRPFQLPPKKAFGALFPPLSSFSSPSLNSPIRNNNLNDLRSTPERINADVLMGSLDCSITDNWKLPSIRDSNHRVSCLNEPVSNNFTVQDIFKKPEGKRNEAPSCSSGTISGAQKNHASLPRELNPSNEETNVGLIQKMLAGSSSQFFSPSLNVKPNIKENTFNWGMLKATENSSAAPLLSPKAGVDPVNLQLDELEYPRCAPTSTSGLAVETSFAEWGGLKGCDLQANDISVFEPSRSIENFDWGAIKIESLHESSVADETMKTDISEIGRGN